MTWPLLCNYARKECSLSTADEAAVLYKVPKSRNSKDIVLKLNLVKVKVIHINST